MTAPTGCHTCGGGAGRHDEAAHSDWPAEEPCHMPIGWNQLCTLPGDHPHDDGCETPLPPYSRKPITLPDGTPVCGWGPEPQPVADTPEGDNCPDCDGDGGWTWTVEGPGGRDVDVDSECHRCDGTGWLP